MGTKVTDEGDHYVVEAHVGYFGKPKRPEGAIRVGKSDVAEFRQQVAAQSRAMRIKLGLRVPTEEPVV